MPWIIDGSNLLGRHRETDAAKRELVGRLAAFARAKRTRVVCAFDGNEPPSFARHLGSVTVVFSGARTADALIAERVAGGRGWTVVTSDRGLAARVEGRGVSVKPAPQFLRELEAIGRDEAASGDDDWNAYFSDPKNRNVF